MRYGQAFEGLLKRCFGKEGFHKSRALKGPALKRAGPQTINKVSQEEKTVRLCIFWLETKRKIKEDVEYIE